MKNLISDALQIIAALLLSGGVLVSAAPPPQASTPVQASITTEVTAKPETLTTVTAEVVVEPTPVTTLTASVAPLNNESITWNFLIAQGFTRNQTAGIMGNLQQEHGFQTSDVPGGLGIAQWMGNRRDNLMARENYLDINVQLQFMMDEMNSSGIVNTIKSYDGIVYAVQVFQNQFERCGVCMEGQRINYAYAILNKY